MTTALIGKQEQVALRARVALVSRGAAKHLSTQLTRSGHDVFEFADWAAFAAAAGTDTLDLVLLDDEQAPTMPRALAVPAVQIGDSAENTAARVLGRVSTNTIEGALEVLVRLAMELRQAADRCREMDRLVEGVRNGSALVGNSPVMRRLHGALSRAADNDATVLIEGPRGSGKSLAARVVHCKSKRSNRPLEITDCGNCDADALTKTLANARGTSLLLEDVEKLPAPAQAVLVRHLKERTGAQQNAGPRLLVTTSVHLPELVARGAFREDLYYRLHTFPVVMPALRERVEDIAHIANAIVDGAIGATGKTTNGLTPAAVALLQNTSWPGNVAQLEATLRRAQALAAGTTIDRDHLLAPAVAVPNSGAAPAVNAATANHTNEPAEMELDENSVRPFEEEEQMLLSRALRATKGNVRRAAQLLGIGRATLYRKIQQYKLRLQ